MFFFFWGAYGGAPRERVDPQRAHADNNKNKKVGQELNDCHTFSGRLDATLNPIAIRSPGVSIYSTFSATLSTSSCTTFPGCSPGVFIDRQNSFNTFPRRPRASEDIQNHKHMIPGRLHCRQTMQ